MDLMSIAFAIVALIIGLVLGIFIQKKNDEKRVDGAKANAEAIVDDAIKQAQNLKREALFEAKEDNLKFRNEVEQELKERRSEATRLEQRLMQKEENLDIKSNNLDKRELNLEKKETEYIKRQEAISEKEKQVQILIDEQKLELERVATLSRQDARE